MVNALTGESRVSRRRGCNVPSYHAAIQQEDWPKPAPIDLTRGVILVGSPSSLAFFDYDSELNTWLRARNASTHEVASEDPQAVQSDASSGEPDPFGFGGGLD